MKKMRRQKLLVLAGATAVAALGASVAMAAHKPINLFTYEELAMQFGQTKLPVAVDANGKGMPYSPKQSCGTPGQFADGTASACHDYGKISSKSFHANQGVSEIVDNLSGQPAAGMFSTTRNKPWTQSFGMIGKW